MYRLFAGSIDALNLFSGSMQLLVESTILLIRSRRTWTLA